MITQLTQPSSQPSSLPLETHLRCRAIWGSSAKHIERWEMSGKSERGTLPQWRESSGAYLITNTERTLSVGVVTKAFSKRSSLKNLACPRWGWDKWMQFSSHRMQVSLEALRWTQALVLKINKSLTPPCRWVFLSTPWSIISLYLQQWCCSDFFIWMFPFSKEIHLF